MSDGDTRSAGEVLKRHLELRAEGDLERDLEENYHPEVVVMTAREVMHGHDGVRKSAHKLWKAVSDGGDYSYETVLYDDRLALLEWTAKTEKVRVFDGVDAYLIEDGLIAGQTIHYRVEDLELGISSAVVSDGDAQGPDDGAGENRLREPGERGGG